MAKLQKNKNIGIAMKPAGKQRIPLSQIQQTGGAGVIRDISNALWFPAGQPIPSVAPKGTPPRRYPYQPMANINWSGRDGGVDFGTLRNFSYYPLVRFIIETVKDRCCSVKWEFALTPESGETKKDLKDRTATDPRIQQLKDFFKKPDGWQNFRTWSRMLYDDMLVIDAASIWMQQDTKGKVASLVQIDGATVFPLIDETGAQPNAMPPAKTKKPVAVRQTSFKAADPDYLALKKAYDEQGGSPAFQLTPYGFPAQQMTADELGYYVRNRLSYRRYGFSPVEQALSYIALSLGRLDFQAAFYRTGNVPEFIAFMPPDVPIQKVEELNGYLDSILSGNLANRRKGFFLPGMGVDGKPNIIFPKVNEQILKDEFDEWLARVLCYCFGLPPTAFIKAVNRATAQQQAETGEEEGLQPYIDWMMDVINDVIQSRFGWDDIEAVPQVRKEQNANVQAQINKSDFESGLASINDINERMGLDPINQDWANARIVVTGTGPVRLDGEPLTQNDALAIQAASQEQQNPDDDQPPGKGSKKKPQPKSDDTTKALIELLGKTIDKKLTDPKDITPSDPRHKWPFASPTRLTSDSIQSQVSLGTHIKKCFAKAKDVFLQGVNGFIAAPAEKATNPVNPDDLANSIWEMVYPEFQQLPQYARTSLESAALSGVSDGIVQIAVSDTGLIQAANRQATNWASERAAELVGMKYSDDGTLMPNPDAKWAISDTTRDEIKDIITKAFQQETDLGAAVEAIKASPGIAYIFSDDRAEMIARTEVGRAQMGSNLDFWEKSGQVAQVQWFCAGANPCEDCEENDGETVALGSPFPSGARSILDSHPNCECGIFAVMD